MRGRSYSPSPPREGYSRRGRSPSPRGRYAGRGRDREATTSLLVRNLPHDCRPEDLRRPFGQFGPLKDIYLPKNYYTGAPRGFGFVQFMDPADAADAKHRMDGQVFQGRELTVLFAEENRKKPTDMRRRKGTRSPPHSSRRYSSRGHSRSPGYSRSPSRRYRRSRSDSRDDYSPSPKRQLSRSISPKEKRSRERSLSRESRGRSYSHSPPPRQNSRSRSRSLSKSRKRSVTSARSQSRSRSPYPEDNHKDKEDDIRHRSPTPSPSH